MGVSLVKLISQAGIIIPRQEIVKNLSMVNAEEIKIDSPAKRIAKQKIKESKNK